ncbi:MAG: FecR family protein [Saprospiraceae bacterium]
MKINHIISLTLIAIVIIGLIIGNIFKNGTEIIQSQNELKTVILPDSSILILGKNSEVRFNRKFKKQQIRIQGKAHIQVADQSIGSLMIDQSLVKIRLKGKEFYFNDDNKNEIIDIVSIDGSARIDLKKMSGQSLFTLEQGDELRFNTDTKLIQTLPTRNQNYLTWKTQQVTFKNQTIAEVITELNNRFGMSIKVNHPDINHCLVNGTFPTEDLSILLQSIANSSNLELNHTSASFILLGKGCH